MVLLHAGSPVISVQRENCRCVGAVVVFLKGLGMSGTRVRGTYGYVEFYRKGTAELEVLPLQRSDNRQRGLGKRHYRRES